MENVQPRNKPFLLFLRIAFLAGVFISGLLAVHILAGVAKDKEKAAWEHFLLQSSKHQSDTITHWLGQQQAIVQDIANTPSAQIYITELEAGNGVKERITDEPAQKEFLQHLLDATASREAFDNGGLALLDKGHNIITTSRNIQTLDQVTAALAMQKDGTTPQLIGPYTTKDGKAFIAFSSPVFKVQGTNTNGDVIGYTVGIRAIDNLAALLQPLPAKETTLQASLVFTHKEKVNVFRTDREGYRVELQQFLPNRDDLSAIAVIQIPNRMLLRKNTYAGNVLALATKVKGSGWSLMQEVSYEEAMQPVNTVTFLSYALYASVFTLLAASVFFASKARDTLRFQKQAEHYQQRSESLIQQKSRLEHILNALPVSVHFTDNESHYAFTNHKALLSYNGIEEAERNRYYREMWNKSIVKTPITTLSYQRNKVIKSTFIPVEAEEGETLTISGILSIEEDITADFTETYALQQIVSMLHVIAGALSDKQSATDCKTIAEGEREKKVLWTD